MRFYDFSNEKLTEYRRRTEKVKKTHPDTHYPSQTARDLLCAAMFLKRYGLAIGMAAELGDTDLCEKIYKEDPEVINKQSDCDGSTPLLHAVKRKRLKTAEWLLKHGAKVLPDKEGMNPVFEACASGCIPALNLFKQYGVDFNQSYSVKRGGIFSQKGPCCPIEVAVICNQPKVAQWLLDNGVNIDSKKGDGSPSVRELLVLKPELFSREMKQVIVQNLDGGKEKIRTSTSVQKKQEEILSRSVLSKSRT